MLAMVPAAPGFSAWSAKRSVVGLSLAGFVSFWGGSCWFVLFPCFLLFGIVRVRALKNS